jgi:hypothetical protein
MNRSAVRCLGVLIALVTSLGAAPATFAGPVSELRPDIGGGAVGLGFDVSPLRWEVVPAAAPGAQGTESGRPLDPESGGTVVSFDLRLRWPGAEGATSRLEPYVALGPALFVVEPDPVGRLLGTRVDPALRVGAKAGAGLNWRLGKHTTLFGAYEVTTMSPSGLGSPGGKGAETSIGGYDFTYGLRFVY